MSNISVFNIGITANNNSVIPLNVSNLINGSLSNQNLSYINPSIAVDPYEGYPTFRIDYYFTFINFQMYTLQNSSVETFIMLYAFLASLFVVFVITLLVISNKAFEALKS